jgi:hypothetical protein
MEFLLSFTVLLRMLFGYSVLQRGQQSAPQSSFLGIQLLICLSLNCLLPSHLTARNFNPSDTNKDEKSGQMNENIKQKMDENLDNKFDSSFANIQKMMEKSCALKLTRVSCYDYTIYVK